MKRIGKRLWYMLLACAASFVIVWVLIGGWSGYIDPRNLTLPAIVGLTYPAAVLTAGSLLVISLLTRSWKTAISLALSLLLTLPALRVTVPLGSSRATGTDDSTFTILSYNVMAFNNPAGVDDTCATMRYILDADADVVMIQEASMGPKDFIHRDIMATLKDEVERKYPYFSRGYHDVIIMSRYPYTVLEDTTLRNGFGAPDNIHTEYHSYAKAFDIAMPGGRQLRVVNVHLQSIGLNDGDKQVYRNITHLDSVHNPNQMKQARHSLIAKLSSAYRRRANEADQLRHVLDECPPNVIVCGDFNDTPASYSYWTISGSDFIDAYVECGRGMTYTFNRDLMLFRIDHVLYRGSMKAVNIRRDKAGTSDHYPLLTTFVWQD